MCIFINYFFLHHTEIIIHRLEEKLVVGPVQGIFEIAQCDAIGRDG